jgi:putative SOS response-associated peptidase YedK
MCGRNSVYVTAKELAEKYSADQNQSSFSGSYNIAPSSSHPVIRQGSIILEDMKWNFVPSWADSYKEWQKKSIINSRIEDVEENNLFEESYREMRCLVPSTGFFEWKGDKGSKQPYFIYPKDKQVMSFAGIWSKYESRDDTVHTFSILTGRPNKKVETLHDRMPVILQETQEEDWISGKVSKQELEIFPGEKLEMHPVDERVNNPEFDSKKATEEPTNLSEF